MRKGKDLQVAIDVAYEAGVILKKNFGKLAVLKTKSDSAADVVTKLDIKYIPTFQVGSYLLTFSKALINLAV